MAAELLKKIIHIDMDAFYASVEQRDAPELRGKPIVVGGSPQGRGVVAAASYEARKYGIHSAMSSKKALQLCSDLIFVRPRFDVYKEISKQIHTIFHQFTNLVEPLSLDEAYLDVTTDLQEIGSALEIAKLIKQKIREELSLTASAGVSINKFLAKIASDMEKPDGLTFIPPSKVNIFLESLPIEKFYGVGKVTAQKMKNLGIYTGKDLKELSRVDIKKYFGKPGLFFYDVVRGIDNREVKAHRKRKSISIEDTYPEDLTSSQEIKDALKVLCEELAHRMTIKGLKGRTVTLKVRFDDFSTNTRSKTLSKNTDSFTVILSVVQLLWKESGFDNRQIRLLGVGISNFEADTTSNHFNKSVQLSLFRDDDF